MAAPMKVTRCVLQRYFQRNNVVQSALFCTKSSESSAQTQQQSSKDPLPVFMQNEVQSLLQKMTGFDIVKLAGPQKVPLRKPVYKLLTDEELREREEAAESRMKYRLQMPPFMKCRQPIKAVLSSDPQLKGLETTKLVFTDITFGVKNRQRLIVVREPDGTLRRANWDERDRINQVYHPVPGRQIQAQAMFQEANLEKLLQEQKYVYVLDMACVQFEPDSPDYIRVSQRTYEAIDSAHTYESLRSTRHFGPMAFYFVWYKKVDYLLIDMINRELISDAGDLIRLYSIVHSESAIAKQLTTQSSTGGDTVSVVKAFLSTEATHKGQLELAIQGYEEKLRRSNSASAAAS